MSVRPLGFRPDEAYADGQHFYFCFRSPAPAGLEKPIVRWVDWHGNLYYQYRDYTEQFSRDTDWSKAAEKFYELIGTGPKPDSQGS